jgi:hypothetical protein
MERMSEDTPQAQAVTPQVFIACPCSPGPVWTPATGIALVNKASRKYNCQLVASVGSWDNFNLLWAQALNEAAKGGAKLFAMLHTDLEPADWWVDILDEERQRVGADILTSVIPQKSVSGINSSGVGAWSDPWAPHQRFTMNEVWAEGSPETFNEEMLGFPTGKYLLHNDGCMIADLTAPCWRKTEQRDGREWLICSFEWVRGIEVVNGECFARGQSEDWYFSRALHRVGANAWMTRKVPLAHGGYLPLTNQCAWGTLKHDDATEQNWKDAPLHPGHEVA